MRRISKLDDWVRLTGQQSTTTRFGQSDGKMWTGETDADADAMQMRCDAVLVIG